MQRYRRRRRENDFISATEIASWAYCPESWRLEYGLELLSANRAALDAGTQHHARKAVAERIAGWLVVLGRALLLAVILVLFAWVLFR
jgi:hypothetical protein